jgi:hypothetical protein
MEKRVGERLPDHEIVHRAGRNEPENADEISAKKSINGMLKNERREVRDEKDFDCACEAKLHKKNEDHYPLCCTLHASSAFRQEIAALSQVV